MNTTKKPSSVFFILAGIFCILYPVISILLIITGPYSNLSYYNIIFISLIYRCSHLFFFIILGIIMLSKKNNMLTVIIFSLFILCYFGNTSLFFGLIFFSPLIMLSLVARKQPCGEKLYIGFIPIIFILLDCISYIIDMFSFNELSFAHRALLHSIPLHIIYCLAFIFVALAINSYPMIKPKKTVKETGYCNLAKHITGLIFCGFIWKYVWIFRTTHYLNIVQSEKRKNPNTELFLCMFIPFYIVFWSYKASKKIDILAKSKGRYSDICTLSTILSVFLPFVSMIIMQCKLNELSRIPMQNNIHTHTPAPLVTPTPTVPPIPQTKISANSLDVTTAIRNFKQLLNDGIITQEEFEAKKKELLNL